MNIHGKKLLILGGDSFSVDIVKTAKAMGVYTIVTDWYDTKRSPAKLLADEYWDISVEAYEDIAQKIKEQHVEGVLTGFTDSYLVHYQRICQLTQVPCYGTEEQFVSLTDKAIYKRLCQQFHVPTTPVYNVDSTNIVYPVMVKPVDGSGSRGITICHNRNEMLNAIEDAKQFSKIGQVLIERYIEGREVTIFWLFIEGQYYLTTIGNRHVKHFDKGAIPLPVGYTFPSVYTTKYRAEVEDNAKRMFQHLDIKNGMLFMQCKVENDTCLVYDIGYRLTGSLEYKILEEVCGYNPLKMMIHFALTGTMTDENISAKIQPDTMSPCFNVSCLCEPGTIARIDGIDTLQNDSNIMDVLVSHFPGDTITEQMRGRLAQITVRILGKVHQNEDLLPIMNRIEKTINVYSTEGKNLRMAGITKEDINGLVLH